jgi:histidinol-phosphate phosphatase family protein
MNFSQQFLSEAQQVLAQLDTGEIDKIVRLLVETRAAGGRLFILGVGGSAANASHAVNDFRKICGIEAYAPTDNVSELTARTNDEGWSGVFEAWLRVSRLKASDAILVFSVGGGNLEKGVSPNLVAALQYGKSVGAKIAGVVGRDGGYTAQAADACACHAARGGVSGSGVAPDRVASGDQAGGDKVGVGALRAVFLDRDGVLNRAIVRDGKPYPPAGLDDFEILPDVAQALAELKKDGFLLIVVTNQPDVARGTQERALIEGMHQAMRQALPIDDFFVCYHDDRDGCDCRKPKAGLLLRAAEKYGVQLTDSYLIGDRWRDIDAGRAAGCTTVWIDRGYRERGPSQAPAARVGSLAEAVRWIRMRDSEVGKRRENGQ